MRCSHATVVAGFLLCSTTLARNLRWNGPSREVAPRQYSGSPCAEISASASSILAASPSATPVVDGQLAYNCLNSVSLHQPQALDLWDSLIQYVYWQTDTNYLKNPPSTYLEPAVDLFGSLDEVRSKIANGTYASEYEFQADLFRVFNLAHDGHFRFFPDLLTGVIGFSRGVGLVSVSEDGVQLPKIYTHGDIILTAGNGSFTPSEVTAINGGDVVSFLEDWSQLGAWNDPDALYNLIFFSKPLNVTELWNGYFSGSGRFAYIWPGAETTMTFANGSSVTYHTTANVLQDFSGVVDGETLYQKFCTGPTTTSSATPSPTATSSSSAIASPTSTQAAPGYPQPVVISSDYTASCYFLDGENSDVAVLALVSFEPDSPAEMQAVVQTCISDAKAAGKTKMVVDLSANPGGWILMGYDAFRQFFPQIDQQGNSRWIESDSFMAISEIYSAAIPANYTPATASDLEIDIYESSQNYRYDYNHTNQHFSTFEDKFSPHVYENSSYTNLMRWDLNDPLTTVNSTYGIGIEITGYGSRKNFTQPFASEDVIMLYDGYCASTCTLFSEFMRLQAGVKSIAMGGRPAVGPMQGIGGVKGAENMGFDNIYSMATTAIELSDASPSTNLSSLQALNLIAYNRSTDTSINVRDHILPANLEDGLPAQFVYEAADCRMFYTSEMILDISAVWKAAANAAWNGASCVNGGLSSTNSSRGARNARSKAARLPVSERTVNRRSPLLEGPFPRPAKTLAWVGRHGKSVPA